jgi:hypothetical protein
MVISNKKHLWRINDSEISANDFHFRDSGK